MEKITHIPFELVFWTLALLAILTISPDGVGHFTLCPLDNLGIHWCPGCGLGRSMKYFMTGEWKASFATHPLGGFAVIIITYRVIGLIKHIKTIRKYG
ncbi:DUF2752 domain-containing protein [Negadavirga shengliensis]|uniref:DUF2752 domain-containing protein n=1 Tax=Negadavirga shengliensis TaxID=1389218 RepID=A0ABV9T962_9BACT